MIAPIHLLIMAALVGVLALCVLGSLARSGMAGIKETMRSNLLALAAFGALSLQAVNAPLWLSIILANTALALALCAYYAGLCRLVGRTAPRRLMALASAVALMAMTFYTYVEPSVTARIIIFSTLIAGFMLAIIVTVGRGMPLNRSRYGYHFLRVAALATAVVCIARCAVYLLGIAQPQALLFPNTWNIVSMTLGVLTMPCLTLGAIIIIHDRMLADREQEANTDFLTGLTSRKAWWLQAERLCAQALRTRRPLSMLLLDIDHFKRINDTHGHAAGDAVLRHFGLLATATLRTGDYVGRVGGEEFAVLFADLRGDAVLEIAGRLLDSVRRTPCAHGGSTISYTFSAGVEEWIPGEGLQTFFERADRKLYAAKSAGRDRIVAAGGDPERQQLAAAA